MKASSRQADGASVFCHSMATGTREFRRMPRRFCFTLGVAVVAACGCTTMPPILRKPLNSCCPEDGLMVGSEAESGQWYAGTAGDSLRLGPDISAVNSDGSGRSWIFEAERESGRIATLPLSTIRLAAVLTKTRLPIASWPSPGIQERVGLAGRRHSRPARARSLPPFRVYC